jgi:aldehyde:ferredoxin oxidoreductase
MRAAGRWGRIEQVGGAEGNGDLDSDEFIMQFPHWGDETHWTLPGIEWAYGGMMGDRDINCHIFTKNFAAVLGAPGFMEQVPVEQWVNTLAGNMGDDFNGDPFMFNYSDDPETGIYSSHKAKQIAFDRRYDLFWMQSAQLCCWVWPNWSNPNNTNFDGWSTSGHEATFFNAVTGRNLTFTDGLRIGGRIWNMDRAIHILQGRTREMETHEGYMFKQPQGSGSIAMPYYKNGQWSYEIFGDTIPGMLITRDGEEEWKTNFYTEEGWNTTTGSPTRATLEGYGLGYVADKLESAGKLGASGTYIAP